MVILKKYQKKFKKTIDNAQRFVYNKYIKMKEEKTNAGFNDIFIISIRIRLVFR